MYERILDIATQHLSHDHVMLADEVPAETMHLASLALGVGLDHYAGERIVALIDQSEYAEAAEKMLSFVGQGTGAAQFDGCVITDRRILAPKCGTGIAFEALQGARKQGTLLIKCVIQAGGGTYELELDCAAELAAFVQALVQVPPAHRVAPQLPLVAPRAGDPSGALSALEDIQAGYIEPDLRSTQLLGLVTASAARADGMPGNVAQDLTARVTLLHRTLERGRGMHGDLWVSPLPPPDLQAAVCRAFGQPSRAYDDGHGARILEFKTSSSWAKSALSSAAGLAVGALVGVGWSSSPSTQVVKVRLVPLGQHCGFQLAATSGSSFAAMRAEDQALLQYAHAILPMHEARLLLLRVLFGWTAPPDQLLLTAPTEAAARMRTLTGFSELSAFIPELAGDPSVDGFHPDIQAKIEREQAKTPAERVAEARASWQNASSAGDQYQMEDAALDLQHAEAYGDAIKAYEAIAERFPAERSRSLYSVGDCWFFSVYGRDLPAAEETRALEAAVHFYGQALGAGHEPEYVEENYWCATEVLLDLAPNDGHRRQLLDRYRGTIPRHVQRPDVDDWL